MGILNCKGTKGTYQETANEDLEKKHSKKLDKKRAKALRKQHKKLQALDEKNKGNSSDSDIPFFMQDASIRSAMRAREFQAQEDKRAAKKAAKEAKKKRKNKSSSDSDDSDDSDSGSSSDDKKKKKKKNKDKDKKKKGKKEGLILFIKLASTCESATQRTSRVRCLTK